MRQTGYGLFGTIQGKSPASEEYCSALRLLLGQQKGALVGEWEKEG